MDIIKIQSFCRYVISKFFGCIFVILTEKVGNTLNKPLSMHNPNDDTQDAVARVPQVQDQSKSRREFKAYSEFGSKDKKENYISH